MPLENHAKLPLCGPSQVVRSARILVVLLVTIMGAGLWWFMRPSTAMPEKMAEASRPAKVEATKPVAPPAIVPPVAPSIVPPVALPISPPAPQPDAAPVAAAQPITESSQDPNADPQAELKTALADIARLERAGDRLELYRTYTPPDKIDPFMLQEYEKEESDYHVTDGQKLNEAIAESYEDLEIETRPLTPPATKQPISLRCPTCLMVTA